MGWLRPVRSPHAVLAPPRGPGSAHERRDPPVPAAPIRGTCLCRPRPSAGRAGFGGPPRGPSWPCPPEHPGVEREPRAVLSLRRVGSRCCLPRVEGSIYCPLDGRCAAVRSDGSPRVGGSPPPRWQLSAVSAHERTAESCHLGVRRMPAGRVLDAPHLTPHVSGARAGRAGVALRGRSKSASAGRAAPTQRLSRSRRSRDVSRLGAPCAVPTLPPSGHLMSILAHREQHLLPTRRM